MYNTPLIFLILACLAIIAVAVYSFLQKKALEKKALEKKELEKKDLEKAYHELEMTVQTLRASLKAKQELSEGMEIELRNQLDAKKQESAELEERLTKNFRDSIQEKDREINNLKESIKELEIQLNEQKIRHQTLNEKITERELSLKEQADWIEQQKTSITDSIKLISHNALEENNERFTKLAHDKLNVLIEQTKTAFTQNEGILKEDLTKVTQPLNDQLKAYKDFLDKIKSEQDKEQGTLKEQISNLLKETQNTKEVASNLRNAMKNPKTQGRWGEAQLHNLLNLMGLQDGIDMLPQETLDNGKRPDFIINIPDGSGKIYIDAKCPTNSYLEALESHSEAEKEQKLKELVKNFTSHIDKLAEKPYGSDEDNIEMVYMYVPEFILATVLARSPESFEYALSKKVVLISASSLVALLHIIKYALRVQKINDNMAEITRISEDIYSKIGTFIEHGESLGKNLDSSVENYNKMAGSWKTMIPSLKKYEQLGLDSKRNNKGNKKSNKKKGKVSDNTDKIQYITEETRQLAHFKALDNIPLDSTIFDQPHIETLSDGTIIDD